MYLLSNGNSTCIRYKPKKVITLKFWALEMIKTHNYVATSIFCAVLLVSDSDVNNENESDLSTPHPPLPLFTSFQI